MKIRKSEKGRKILFFYVVQDFCSRTSEVFLEHKDILVKLQVRMTLVLTLFQVNNKTNQGFILTKKFMTTLCTISDMISSLPFSHLT